MFDALYEFSHYAPFVIFMAAALDVFFITGYLLYGFAMASSVAMLHMTGMISTEMLILSAFLGTYSSNCSNFLIGSYFGHTTWIQRRLSGPRIEKAQHLLQDRGLFLCIAISRSITFIRPAYALVLGTLKTTPRSFFIYEAFIAFVWVTFWALVIISGEQLIFNIFTSQQL